MSAETVVKFPRITNLLCASCGASGKMNCGCGVEYIKAAEFAARAVAANPEKSNRLIAAETGVSDMTVGRARKRTAPNVAVEKRTGRDGKKRRTRQRAITMHPADWAEFKAKVGGDGLSVATKIGEVLTRAVVGGEVDPASLPKTAQAKLAAAIRHATRGLEADYAVRVREFDEQVRRKVLERNKDYLEKLNKLEVEATHTRDTYRAFMEQQAKIFTKDEFRLVLMCVHADPAISTEKRDEATRLLLAKRFALTSER